MANNYAQQVHRAALPEVMLIPDIALALQLTPQSTRLAVQRGDCGPFFRVGRRLAVLRESFLAALAQRETLPAGESNHPLLPFPKSAGQPDVGGDA